jgi:hypothetical protein
LVPFTHPKLSSIKENEAFTVPDVVTQSPPLGLLATSELRSVTVGVPVEARIPPPLLAELLLNVELLRVTVVAPLTATPPPLAAELPLIVELVIEQLPSRHATPPPIPDGAELPLIVELFTIKEAEAEPELKIPPPPVPFDTLFETTMPVSVSVPPAFSTPPPFAALSPFEIVRPLIETVKAPFTRKTFDALFPETVSALAPGPVMVKFLVISIAPVVRVIGLARPAVKVIVLPSQASTTACRRLPLPLSLLVVTTGADVHTVWSSVSELPL